MSRQVAAEMGTRHADRIILSPLPGIGVHEQGGLLELAMNGTRRVLTIGAPSIVDLSVPQFRAILGHEYAHISNKDTRWTALTFRAFSAVQQTIVAMDAIGQRRGWFALVALLNPARWVILGYLWLFAYVTTGFSRLREVLADVAAVETYGAEAFKGGLRTVMLNDSLFGQRGLPAMLTLAREGRQLADVYRAMEQTKAAMYPWDLEQAWDLAARGSASAFDSHPAVKDRLHYADVVVDRGQPIAPGVDQHEALWTWFADWSARCTQLTELLNSRLKTA
jgi:Zn-dependent protease with chaperone function